MKTRARSTLTGVISSLAVFASSRDGHEPALLDAARDVGAALAARGVTLVYGGGGRGLMGAVAHGTLEAGGEVVGVIPRFMVEREWALRAPGVRLCVVDTMHERKAEMARLADASLTLPGGLGTLEEFFELWTWRTLDLCGDKPVGLLDVGGFWAPLRAMLVRMVDAGFVGPDTLDDLVVAATLDEALDGLARR